MHRGNPPSPNFLLLLQNLFFLILSHLCLPNLSLLIQREKESKEAKTWWRPGGLVLLTKLRPSELQNSKRLVRRHSEEWKGEVISLQSLRLGLLHSCSVVNPWEMMHHSGISTGVLDTTSPRPWRGLCYFLRIWPSCGILGRTRFSSTSKDI